MYSITFRSGAVKELRKLPGTARKRVASVIDLLATDPRPHGVKKMVGLDAWRLRAGDYRIVYSIADQQLVIEIIKIGHRREVYR